MTQSVPTVPTENGNTKHSQSPAIRWCFTFNNYTDKLCSMFHDKLILNCKKFVYQKEVGELGTPHLQGSIWLTKKGRPISLFGFKQVHWEKMRNEEASIKYCQKSETSVGEPVIFGFPKPINVITTLRPWQQDIFNICKSEPDNRKVYWYWENKGNVGKSAFVKFMCVKHNAIFIDGGAKKDVINLIFNSDMDKSNIILFDIPRCNLGKISYSAIESIKNGLICNTKYETGFRAFNNVHVIVFANSEPLEKDKLSKDRWVITEITL